MDEYGRPEPDGTHAEGRSGPVIPPMPEQRRSGKWPAFLKNLLKSSPRCLGCGRKAETGHHVLPFGTDEAKELDPNNIAPVCVPCHFVICHGGDWHNYIPGCLAALAAHLLSVRTARPIGK